MEPGDRTHVKKLPWMRSNVIWVRNKFLNIHIYASPQESFPLLGNYFLTARSLGLSAKIQTLPNC